MTSLSVVSLAYNQEEYIIPFLDSIAAQTGPDFEFIIVDDASTDRTADLIADHLPRLGRQTRLIRHQENRGAGAAAASAFSQASGDICIKVDADSILEPETCHKIMDAFASADQVGLVAVLYQVLGNPNRILRATETLIVAQQRCDRLDNQYSKTAYGTCFAFRRRIFSLEELSSRIDIDLSQLARKRGWKIALREDVVVRTRFPATLAGVFGRGRRMAREELPTHWEHRELLLTHWGFWAKFTPLILFLMAAFRPQWALAGLLGWLISSQIWLARRVPDYTLGDRLAAWGASAIRWSGFCLETLLMAGQGLVQRIQARQKGRRGP